MSISDFYTGTVDKDGERYHTVDTNALVGLFDELREQVEFGKKVAVTKAYLAAAGEEIITSHGSGEETRYTAVGGEVVFDNGGGDKFVPRDGEGKSNGAELLQTKYELVKGSLADGDAEFIPASKASQILIGVNPDPIRILNPWGPGSTQDLPAGSTLKLDGDKVTGIEREAFAKTWGRTTPAGEILQNAASPRADGQDWAASLGDRKGRIKG